MKRLFFLLVPGLAFAQQSLVARFPYIPDPGENPTPKLLDSRAKLAALSPITIEPPPANLPDELAFSAEDRVWLEKLREAQQLIGQGLPAEAKPILEEFLSKYPQHAPSRIAYADCLLSLKSYAAAERNYLDFLADYPMHFPALNNLAWMYATTRGTEWFRPAEALILARKALVSAPESHHVWSTLSQIHFALGHYEEARDAAQSALSFAQRTSAGALVDVSYLMQIDNCRAALLATSLMV
jgi:tetratricopeptide (TPR) repeat protein